MATIPTPPVFASNDHSLANLQALAACAEFLGVVDDSSNANTLPVWHFYRGSGSSQSITASTLTGVQCGTIAIDTDGVFSSSGMSALLVTQGYYVVEATHPFVAPATACAIRSYFELYTGSSSPRGAGITTKFGLSAMGTGTADNLALNISDMTPYCCYPGDTITHYVYSTGAITVRTGGTPTGATGRSYCTFSGRWARTGV